jgi:hypothetical protein
MESDHEAYKAAVGQLQASGQLQLFHAERFAARLRTALYAPAGGADAPPAGTSAAAAAPSSEPCMRSR